MDRKPDIEGLEEFSRLTGRELTEFFTGREHEIDFITQSVGDVARRHRNGIPFPAKGRTMLITGVPGAGKTSLMDWLGAGWSDAEGSGPIGINIALDHLRSTAGLAEAIRQRVPGSRGERLAAAFASFSFSLLGSGAAVELREPRNIGLRDLDRPVVLFIDEIQRIPADAQAPEVRVLNELHLGNHGAPVVPVLAGLADTVDVLEDVGLTRLGTGSILPLGPLSRDEAYESVRKFLDSFNVAGDRAGWPETVADWSDGWPMHVHNTLRALAGGLARNGGDLDRIDRPGVKREAAAHRTDYYKRRTGRMFENERKLLAAVMEGLGETGLTKIFGLQRRAITNLLVEHGGGRPAGMKPDDAFRALLYRGLLQRTPGIEEARYACPIPSLRSWCAAGSGNDLHRPAMSGNAVVVAAGLEADEDPNVQDIRGRTPLHIAAEEGWPNIAGMLLDAGADPGIPDNDGRTPAEIARGETASAIADRARDAAKARPGPASKPAPKPERGPDFGM